MARKRFKVRKLKIVSKIQSKAAAVSPPPWIELPGDMTANILGRLGAEEILTTAQSVCSTWWKVCHEHPAMWRVIHLPSLFGRDYTTMCRRAVDRSQGQLADLHLDSVGDNELIEYIVQRSSNLKRLKLDSCYISGECLSEAVKKLPQLEELHLDFAPRVKVGAVDIKIIGISCPELKSFSFHGRHYSIVQDNLYEGIDLAIGKSMPNLCHLQLFANCVQNQGLEAILDGCPHLESLDIRQCYGLDLGGDLWRRCRNRIKDLKLHSYDYYDRLSEDEDDYHYSCYEFETFDDYNELW